MAVRCLGVSNLYTSKAHTAPKYAYICISMFVMFMVALYDRMNNIRNACFQRHKVLCVHK